LGGETNIFKTNNQDVTASRVHYSIDGGVERSFNLTDSPTYPDVCPGPSSEISTFPAGGSCFNTGSDGSIDVLDQRWQNQSGSENLLNDPITGLPIVSGQHTVNFHFETDHNNGGGTVTEMTGSGSFTFEFNNLPSGAACNGALLPVLLDQFYAKKDKESVVINWQTLSELNNSHFEVQQSINSKTWKTIGKVEGKGTTNEVQNYAYTDKSPSQGINYYRLKQVDYDGAFEYSFVVSAEMGKDQAISVFPNPVTDNVVFEFETEQKKGTLLSVYNMNGQVVRQVRLAENYSKMELELSDLVEGIYMVEITNGETHAVERFIKQ
jgi:hypothetical protein